MTITQNLRLLGGEIYVLKREMEASARQNPAFHRTFMQAATSLQSLIQRVERTADTGTGTQAMLNEYLALILMIKMRLEVDLTVR
jgi:hypothetical protein